MHRHHGRCGQMHGMMSDEDPIHLKMRCHGMGHGPGMGHEPSMFGRHFLTDEEKIEMLEKYEQWLEKESKGVRELLEKKKKIISK